MFSDKGRIIILGGKYFSFLEMVDGAKQKAIDMPRKNQSKTNLFPVKLPKKGWQRRKTGLVNFKEECL